MQIGVVGVDADYPLGMTGAEKAGDVRADVPAVRSEPRITQHVAHQPSPQVGDNRWRHRTLGGQVRETKPG
jgi:hypothetical protein